ncbi:MAG TPA: DUF167 domain-containing protein [Desulfonatronum sp.]|nr:DUF167 domain-containing protein [Desulfonatronum sp.]
MHPECVLQDSGQGWLLRVWVQPGAKSNGVVEIRDGSLKLRLTAPAVDNKANKALVDFVAGLLDLPRRQVCLVSGASGRRKKLRIVSQEEPAWDRLVPAGLRQPLQQPRSISHGTA